MSAQTKVLAAAFATALLMGHPIAIAQQPAPNPADDQPTAKTIPDEKLSAAAAALADVVRIRHDYQQQLAEAPPAEQKRVSAEGTHAMEQAVTDKGLSVGEYNEILQMAKNDPDFREKLFQRAAGALGNNNE